MFTQYINGEEVNLTAQKNIVFAVKMKNTKFRNLISTVTYTQSYEQSEFVIDQLPNYIDCSNIEFTIEEVVTEAELFTGLEEYALHVWFDKNQHKSGPYRLVLISEPDTGDFYYRDLDDELAFFSFPLSDIKCLSNETNYQTLIARCRRVMAYTSKSEQPAMLKTLLQELNTTTKIA